MVKVIDGSSQQAPNGHGSSREIISSQKHLKPAKDALNDGVVPGGSNPWTCFVSHGFVQEDRNSWPMRIESPGRYAG